MKNIILILMVVFSQLTFARDAASLEDLEFGSLKIGATLEDIKEEYGEPLLYRDLSNLKQKPYYLFESFKVYMNANPEIITIEILDSTIPTIHGVRVGDDIETLRKKLGEYNFRDRIMEYLPFMGTGDFDQDFADADKLSYFMYVPPEGTLTSYTVINLVFYFRGNKLARIMVTAGFGC